MTQLDAQTTAFWENLSLLSNCRLQLEMPTCSVVTELDTSSAHLFENILTFLDCGLSLDITYFTEIYATSSPPALHLISSNRKLVASLYLNEKEAASRFHFFAKSFALEQMPENFVLEQAQPPSLCPCCIDAAQFRIRQIAQNPLTAILAHAASIELPLIVTLRQTEGCLTFARTPVTLLRQDENLISEGSPDRLKISIRHLHAMCLTEESLDGQSHQSLALLSSHGEVTSTLSAPSKEIAETWRTILHCRDHHYEVLNSHSNS